MTSAVFLVNCLLLSIVLGGSAPSRSTSSSRNSAAVTVFADENVQPQALPPQNSEYRSLPTTGAENQQKPGRWTDAKVYFVCKLLRVCCLFLSEFEIHP